MAGVVVSSAPVRVNAPASGADDPRWVRWLLIALTLGFLTLFVILPAANVFAQALGKGWGTYSRTFFAPRPDKEEPTTVQYRRMGKEKADALKTHWKEFRSAERNWNAIKLTAGVAAIVVPLNAAFGLAAAWAVTRFRFKGRALLVSLIDLPFSVSPVVAGLIFVLVFGAQGVLRDVSRWEGGTFLVPAVASAWKWGLAAIEVALVMRWIARWLHKCNRAPGAVLWMRRLAWPLGGASAAIVLAMAYLSDGPRSWAWVDPATWLLPDLRTVYWMGFGERWWWPVGTRQNVEGVMFTPVAIVIATTFVTFPFIARTLIPVMEANGSEEEIAALSLGATGRQMFWRITVPNAKWGLFYGVVLCVARACGEFGAVSVVGGGVDSNDTIPLRIQKLWEETHTAEAFALASLLALLAVVTLGAKAVVERRMGRSG